MKNNIEIEIEVTKNQKGKYIYNLLRKKMKRFNKNKLKR